MVKLLECLDNEKIDGKPDRTAPVRIAAKQAGRRLGRFVTDFVHGATNFQAIRMFQVVTADGPDAVLAQELRRVEHAVEQPLHAMPAHQGQQAAFTHAGFLPA